MNLTAQLIASLMDQNTDALHAGRRTRAEWLSRQVELWRMAGEAGLGARVLALRCPVLTPPPSGNRRMCEGVGR